MGRIIIDATQLVHWSGKLTGVPRVMNELSMRFAKEGEVVFVEWSEPHNAFLQVIDMQATLASRDAPAPVAEVVEAKQSLTSRAIAKIRRVEQRSVLVQAGLKLPKKAAKKALQRAQPVVPNILPGSDRMLEPKKGDLLFVLCDWHERLLVDKVAALHQNGVRVAVISYDMLPLVTPQYSGHATERLTYFVEKLYPISEVVIAISEHTKKDVTAWLTQKKLRVPRIEVMRLGDDFQIAHPKKPEDPLFRQRKLKGKDYLLCTGTIEARKNHTLLYYVYKLAHQRGIALPKIVIVGRRGWRTDDVYELITTDPETKDSFVLLQNAADEELSWLYEHCLFSVYPSFYEGWGLPIAESIAHGVPCVCSNTSSMPEIAGDIVTYFSPNSTDECLAAIERLLQPKELEHARKRLKQYKPVRWQQTFNFVNKIVGEV